MVHRTMQGRSIDMDKLMRQNELTPAVGNMKVNARGDELGSNGGIVKKREEVVAEYYEGKKPVRNHLNEVTSSQSIEETPVSQKSKKINQRSE